MERALKQHFEAEANDLGAPENLWELLEGRLEGQPASRGWRRIIDAIGRIWTPALAVSASGAAVVAVLAVLLTSRGGGEVQIVEVVKEVPVEKVVEAPEGDAGGAEVVPPKVVEESESSREGSNSGRCARGQGEGG